MPIHLTDQQVRVAMTRIASGLAQYRCIQDVIEANPRAVRLPAFRKQFNLFYRVRRCPAWQEAFYGLLEEQLHGPCSFDSFLDEIVRRTNRVEASFSSKAVATLRPDLPVLDRYVLQNLGLQQPRQHLPQASRVSQWKSIYANVDVRYRGYLKTERGRSLVKQFQTHYPDTGITETKMLDLVLWQTR